jgi:hypothetical protein
MWAEHNAPSSSLRHDHYSQPRISEATIALAWRMAEENPLCGAERISGELLKLGI